MSQQDISTNRIALASLEEEDVIDTQAWAPSFEPTFSVSSPTAETPLEPGLGSDPVVFSAETYADRLMDELFEDVELALDGSAKLPTEAVQPEYVSLQPITIPAVALPPTLTLNQNLVAQVKGGELETLLSDITRYTEQSRRQQARRSWGRLFLGAVCTSLVVAAGVWFASQGGLKRFTSPATTAPATTSVPAPVPQVTKAEADSQFANYLKRSLEVIDQQVTAKKVASTAGNQGANANAEAAKPGTPATGTVLERVYIPVFQPPQTVYTPPAATTPSAPKTATLPPVTVPIPQRPVAVAPAPVPALPAPPAPAVPVATHTLVGLLELGDRSAALFEMDGVTRRVQVGESIGASGWTLVKVANQEAVMRRNGEVRSIYIGQKF